MLLHNVFFWLKNDLTPAQVAEFEEGLKSLLTIPVVRHGFYGRPSSTNRPIIDRTYTFGLTLAFDSLADHDIYQDHPIHHAFVKPNQSKWEAVKIYDFE